MEFIETTKGGRKLSKDGFLYIKNKTLTNGRTYWECAQRRSGNGCNVYSKTELTKQNQKTKLTELEYNIPDVSNLAKKTTTIENKIPDVSSLVKKTDYNTKVTEIENKLNNHNHDKYTDTQEFNTLRLFLNRDQHKLI